MSLEKLLLDNAGDGKLVKPLQQVIDLLNKRNNDDYRTNPAKYYADLGNGWYSTSKLTPINGGIFKDVKDINIISFTDKYRQKRIGVIDTLSYAIYGGMKPFVCITCITNDANPYGDANDPENLIGCLLHSVKDVTLLYGDIDLSNLKFTGNLV